MKRRLILTSVHIVNKYGPEGRSASELLQGVTHRKNTTYEDLGLIEFEGKHYFAGIYTEPAKPHWLDRKWQADRELDEIDPNGPLCQ